MAMCYKLIIIGGPIDGTAQILGYNYSLGGSFYIPYSTLKNNYNCVAYHLVSKAVSAAVTSLLCITVKYILYDIITNTIGRQHHFPLINYFLVSVYFRLEKGVR